MKTYNPFIDYVEDYIDTAKSYIIDLNRKELYVFFDPIDISGVVHIDYKLFTIIPKFTKNEHLFQKSKEGALEKSKYFLMFQNEDRYITTTCFENVLQELCQVWSIRMENV